MRHAESRLHLHGRSAALGSIKLEIERIFAEDQKDRAGWRDWAGKAPPALAARDAARRARTAALVKSGALRTGEDYERAAFIFQHGREPADFLMAHVLAMTARSLDPGRGAWIAAATLDRYLLSTEKAPVFGTNLTDAQPFDRAFLTDAMRVANCVPSLAERERILRAIEKGNQPLPAVAPCQPRLDQLAGTWSITERLPGGGFAHSRLVWPDSGDDGILFQEAARGSTSARSCSKVANFASAWAAGSTPSHSTPVSCAAS